MPREARTIVPGVPHHVTQRGVRRLPTFFEAEDYALYRRLLAAHCERHDVTVLAYCLMPNHVHLVAVPGSPTSLARALGDAHSIYARAINARKGWSGHLWQARFYSVPLEPRRALATVRYVLQNPVRAQLVHDVAEWAHSSARDLLGLARDGLVRRERISDWSDNWADVLRTPLAGAELTEIRAATKRGCARPKAPQIPGEAA